MTTAHRAREVIERYVDAHRTGDTSTLAEIIAPDFRYRASARVGVEGVASAVRTFRAAFSEIACSVEQLVSGGEWAAFRFEIAGNHTGVFAGRAPTGRRITWWGADFVRLRDGKMVELWAVQESLPLMEGVGAVERVGEPSDAAG